MKLYHGSNITVKNPIIRTKLRSLDFGAGFYLTSSHQQAERWANSVARRRGKGKATINIYHFDDDNMEQLELLIFETANSNWLDFVVANRKDIPPLKKYDLVIGPVANDSTLPVIDDYMDGKYTKIEAIKRLMPQNLTVQYAFLTQRALDMLHFEGAEVNA